MEFLPSKQLIILARCSWTIYVIPVIFIISKNYEKENHYFRKEIKFSYFLFLISEDKPYCITRTKNFSIVICG